MHSVWSTYSDQFHIHFSTDRLAVSDFNLSCWLNLLGGDFVANYYSGIVSQKECKVEEILSHVNNHI